MENASFEIWLQVMNNFAVIVLKSENIFLDTNNYNKLQNINIKLYFYL